jgi:hypothetical protein
MPQLVEIGEGEGGSITAIDTLLKILEPAKDMSLTEDERLTTVATLLTALSVHNPSIKNGVGGFFTGAYLNCQGIHWAKDITHLLISGLTITHGEHFSVHMRTIKNAVFLASPKSGAIRIYPNRLYENFHSDELTEESVREWFDELKKQHFIGSTYTVFIRIDKPIVILVRKRSNFNVGYFRTIRTDDNGLEIQVSEHLITAMTSLDQAEGFEKNETEQVLKFTWL